VLKLKKVVLVTNMAKVKLLEEAGFSPCGTREIDGTTVYQLVVTDKLFKLLNDNSQFSKKDYVYDMKLTF